MAAEDRVLLYAVALASCRGMGSEPQFIAPFSRFSFFIGPNYADKHLQATPWDGLWDWGVSQISLSTKRKASTREAFTLFTLGRPKGCADQRFTVDFLPNLCSSQHQP